MAATPATTEIHLPALRAQPGDAARRARTSPSTSVRSTDRRQSSRLRVASDPRPRGRGRLHRSTWASEPHLQHLRRAPAAALGGAGRPPAGAQARAVHGLLHGRRERAIRRCCGCGRCGRARRGEAREVLASGRYADEVRDAEQDGLPRDPLGPGRHHQWQVPDPGGQPVEAFEQALREIAAELGQVPAGVSPS